MHAYGTPPRQKGLNDAFCRKFVWKNGVIRRWVVQGSTVQLSAAYPSMSGRTNGGGVTGRK